MVVITSFPNFGLQNDKQPLLIYSVLPLFMHDFSFIYIITQSICYRYPIHYQETPHRTTSSAQNALKTEPTQLIQLYEFMKGLYSKRAFLC